MKYCEDCKWPVSYGLLMCGNPQEDKNIIDTVPVYKPKFCSCKYARTFGKCGWEGKLWEAKDAV